MTQSEHGSSGKSTLSAQSECRKCGQAIYWHTSSRTGKKYPCDSESRSDFHQCAGGAPLPKPALKPELDTCEFDPTTEERITVLEQQVKGLIRTVLEISERLPIADKDVPF